MISTSRLRQELRISPNQDELVVELKSVVIDLWERATGSLWNKRTGYVEDLTIPDDEDHYYIWPALRPVTAITTIQERDRTVSSWTLLASDKYIINGLKIEKLTDCWSSRVRLTYTGGYDETTCPQSVKRALILQAQFMTHRLGEDKIAIKSENFEGGSGTFEEAFLHPYFLQHAKQHRRKV
jgi:hypothetical protein